MTVGPKECPIGCSFGHFVAGMPTYIFICFILTVLCSIAVATATLTNLGAPKRKPGARPSYGIGGIRIVTITSGLGIGFSLPVVILYFFWRTTNEGLACYAQYSEIGAPLWACFFAYTSLSVLLFNELRIITRHSLTPLLHIATGNESMLTFNTFRGVFLSPLAKEMLACRQRRDRPDGSSADDGRKMSVEAPSPAIAATAFSPYYGQIVGYDCDYWVRGDAQHAMAWCVENMLREGIDSVVVEQQPPAFIDPIVNSDFSNRNASLSGADRPLVRLVAGRPQHLYFRLPFPSRSFSHVYCPFLTSHTFCSSYADEPSEQQVKLESMVRECHRVLASGGRLVAPVMFWHAKKVRQALASVAEFHQIHRENGLYWTSSFPVVVYTAIKSGYVPPARRKGSSEVEVAHEEPALGGSLNDEDDYLRLTERRLSIEQEQHEMEAEVEEQEHEKLEAATYQLHKGLRLCFAAALVATFVLLMVLTHVLYCHMLVPTHIPWSNYVISLMIENVTFFPLTVWGAWLSIRKFCSEQDDPSVSDVALEMGKVLAGIVMALTAYNVLFWLPSFVVDVILYDHVSEGTISSINVLVNAALVFFLAHIAPTLIKYAQRKLAARRERKSTSAQKVAEQGADARNERSPLLSE